MFSAGSVKQHILAVCGRASRGGEQKLISWLRQTGKTQILSSVAAAVLLVHWRENIGGQISVA